MLRMPDDDGRDRARECRGRSHVPEHPGSDKRPVEPLSRSLVAVLMPREHDAHKMGGEVKRILYDGMNGYTGSSSTGVSM